MTPGIAGLPANGITQGDSGNGYSALSVGVHSFLARRAGDLSVGGTVYTTTTNLPWLWRQAIPNNAYQTIVVAGIIPSTGNIPNNTIPTVILDDDPFPGPKFDDVYQARFKVIHAAPFTTTTGTASNGRVNIYVTPGTTAPADLLANYVALGNARYRNQSAYFNVDAGTYVVTLAASNVILAQQPVTFSAGDVCTLVLQSNGPSATPGIANHTLTVLLDHRYGSSPSD
jgi:hypothetical protein